MSFERPGAIACFFELAHRHNQLLKANVSVVIGIPDIKELTQSCIFQSTRSLNLFILVVDSIERRIELLYTT